MANPALQLARENPGRAVDSAGAMSWYLTGTGEIIRGQVIRDPNWEDRKRAQLGGLTFLGHAEYGPGGDCLPALEKFVREHPELRPLIDRARDNRERQAYERAHRADVKLQRKAAEKAIEAAAIVEAIRMVQQEQTADTDEPVRRGPGRPPKTA